MGSELRRFHSEQYQNIQYVLLDIEGTISDIQFVRDVLFPYSAGKMASFVKGNLRNPAVQAALAGVDAASLELKIEKLLQWVREDNKHPSLKSLQGMIWKQGFESGEFQSHLYPDVLPTLNRWKECGLTLGIYSSGSIDAQKLFFKHTTYGNTLNLFSNHFDLSTGSKKEMSSYQKIAKQIGLEPTQILFLSDIEAELYAAEKAKFSTGQLVREGTTPSSRHLNFRDLTTV